MNFCKNECGFPEQQSQIIVCSTKGSPDKKRASRYTGKIKKLDGIWIELRSAHVDSIEGNVSCLPSRGTELAKANGFRIDCHQFGQIQKKSHQRIISIRHLFSNTPKFQRHFSRGVFLSCLIYSEDKVLVTLDDLLPAFQIDEDLSTSFQSDFHWLHKISCIWNDVKFLKTEMEKCDSASALHFRLKILQTVVTMQDALDLRDLGKVYYKPIITENNNVTYICTVNHLRSTKLVSAPNVRWTSIDKLKGRKASSDTYEVLSNCSQNLMIYHQMSNMPLGKGLYLGYFKLVSSVDLLKLFVPEKTPSILPHVKIRNNPYVTKEEWDLLLSMTSDESKTPESPSKLITNGPPFGGTFSEAQLLFRQQLDSSLKKLFSNLKVDRNSALNHRFYTTEIVEVSSSVSFLILLPPTDTACLLEADTKDSKWIEDNKLMTLPIQVFEMTHLLTYHNTLARRFMRLSATLEVETSLGQHNRRKAFSTEEMSQAQHQLAILSHLQTKLETTWKDCRWILEVVKAARAKDKMFVTLRDFLNRYNNLNPSAGNYPPDSEQFRKFSKGAYVNVNGSPFHKANKKASAKLLPDLPGPSIPSNPNFKYESCSSLPIVSTKGSSNYDKIRCSASLYNLKAAYGSRKNSADGLTLCETTSVMQELDSYMRHTSSRSKLVSLSTMTSKPSSRDGNDKGCVPGTDEPPGLRTISWKKQRGSLDRCFDQPMSLLNSRSYSSSSSRELLLEEEEAVCLEIPKNRIVEIYAAYECGLSCGTCVRLQITNETTTRQIIELLVQKLNEEAKSKSLPVAVFNSIDDFCLVSVIGARERVLRMDYKPLLLQRPWDSARLFVRKKREVTSAVSLESSIMNMTLEV